MNKILLIALCVILGAAALAAGVLYRSESAKNSLLRSENLKTSEEAQAEVKKLKEDFKEEHDKNLADRQKLLDSMNQLVAEKDKAVKDQEDIKKTAIKEREISLVAGDDMEKLRKDVASLGKEGKENIAHLEETFKKKQQNYEARILSLDAQLSKAKAREASDAERYHYNLGVIYTQNKDYDSAVQEFKTALGYNPKNAQAHYNLGIIYDDFFKDKENARFHYRTYLDLAPTTEDADSVREWLANLDKK